MMRSRIFRAALAALVVGGGATLLVGCGGDPTPMDTPCTIDARFTLSASLFDFEAEALGGAGDWYATGDPTGATSPSPAVQCDTGAAMMSDGQMPEPAAPAADSPKTTESATIVQVPPDRAHCGKPSTKMLRLVTHGHTEWGSLAGNWHLAQAPLDGTVWDPADPAGTPFVLQFPTTVRPPDGSAWDGIALWARSEAISPENSQELCAGCQGGTDRSVTIVIDTLQTTRDPALAADATAPIERGGCRVYCKSGLNFQQTDASGNVVVGFTAATPADACGNSFTATITTTDRWRLYRVPWTRFSQERQPNAVRGGIDPAVLRGVSFRFEKEATLNLSIDDVAFYRGL